MTTSEQRRKIFEGIYYEHSWGGESRSGPGSSPEQTVGMRSQLSQLIKELNVVVLLDVPCGDFSWMQYVDVPQYVGMDIVPELIKQNIEKYSTETYRFMLGDLVSDNLPIADMILCRDCFPHLSIEECIDAVSNFKRSQSKYLVLSTCLAVESNSDINTGACRAVNLQLEPFSFPEPLKYIDEKDNDYKLGVWETEKI